MSTVREKYRNSNPEFPWLSLDDAAGVEGFLLERGWLEPGERLENVSKAGDGNMNLTLLVSTNRRRVVLKQARPWVEKYDHIEAPWDRMEFERRFYERVAPVGEVASRMPKLLRADSEARCILIEALDDASDFTSLYAGGGIGPEEIEELIVYLAALHGATRGAPDSAFANRDMRRLNHQHIFCIPLDVENGLDLERFEPGLNAAAERLKGDKGNVDAVAELGKRYLADGPALVHGDFFPGSWLRSRQGVRVIDPEFCFYGDPEFDLGVWVAHLALARQPAQVRDRVLSSYEQLAAMPVDQALVARYAATEIMRRLIGVAQLPIPTTEGWRARMLEQSREALLSGEIGAI